MIRVVLDTNVLVSALLFEGELAQLVSLWQKKTFLILLSRPILDEYLRVLSYSKFQLTDREIQCLIEEEILPYAEIVTEAKQVKVPKIEDQDDVKFLEAALRGKADYLVTGDRAFAALKRYDGVEIVRSAEFLTKIKPNPSFFL